MDAAAHVHRRAFDERLSWLAGLHTPDEDRAYFRDTVFAECEVWGAWAGTVLTGFAAFRDGWIDQLYVLPEAQSSGIGTALLAVAKGSHPRLSLWTFQRNSSARRFYETHGFVVVRETDGSGNEEREPDILYCWERAQQVR